MPVTVQGNEKRIVDSKQTMPRVVASETAVEKDIMMKYADLSGVLWMAAFVVFFIERIISFSTRSKETYG